MRHLPDYQKLHCWSDGLYSYTFPLKLAGGHYGRRMIVCRSPRGDQLLLISPLPLPEDLANDLEALGTITTVVIPTCFHDTQLKQLRPLLDHTKVFAPSGFERSLPQARAIDALPEPWTLLLEWQLLEGMPKVNETVFYHRLSKTLLPSDLLFKFSPAFSPWTRLLGRIMGTYPQLRPTRLFMSLVKDRPKLNASLQRILEWDIQLILPSHAETIDGPEGRPALQDVSRAQS